jgi:hypothetical protein
VFEACRQFAQIGKHKTAAWIVQTWAQISSVVAHEVAHIRFMSFKSSKVCERFTSNISIAGSLPLIYYAQMLLRDTIH